MRTSHRDHNAKTLAVLFFTLAQASAGGCGSDETGSSSADAGTASGGTGGAGGALTGGADGGAGGASTGSASGSSCSRRASGIV